MRSFEPTAACTWFHVTNSLLHMLDQFTDKDRHKHGIFDFTYGMFVQALPYYVHVCEGCMAGYRYCRCRCLWVSALQTGSVYSATPLPLSPVCNVLPPLFLHAILPNTVSTVYTGAYLHREYTQLRPACQGNTTDPGMGHTLHSTARTDADENAIR